MPYQSASRIYLPRAYGAIMIETKNPDEYVAAIRKNGLSIYSHISVGSELWIPTSALEMLLDRELAGISLAGLPIRTRSKVVKEYVCIALGYSPPPVIQNRGADLHRLVCQALGYDNYHDNGQFPDILHQLLEVKLQTSPTIDLGLVTPDSTTVLNIPMLNRQQVRHCDVRYALFYAVTDGREVTLTHFYLTTGQAFFDRFPQFQGRVLNRKLQIPLPGNFFD